MQHKKISRRHFVKETSLATGGILLSTSVLAANLNLKKEKTLKLALVGCGGRGTGAAVQALKADDNVKLVAMADAFEDQIEKSLSSLSQIYDNSRLAVKPHKKFVGFGSYKKAIDEADVVILTTPPGFRPLHFEYAIKQGKHVFMEKPVATDVAGIKKVLEAAKLAKDKKLNVVVGLQRRYQAEYLEVKKRINNGDLGNILSGQVYWNGAGVWVRPRQAGMTEMEYQMRNWYYFNWLCGDHILEQHIHNIDVANWFIGEHPIKAQGMGGRQVRNGKDHGQIFDHHFVEFTYPSGAIISSQCRHQPGCFSQVSETFQATLGNSYTGGGNTAILKDYGGNTIYKHNGEHDENPYQVEHNRLFAAIRNKREIINDAEIGANSTMTAIMGRMATYSGKLITWDEAMDSNLELVPNEDLLDFSTTPPVVPDADGNYPIPVPGKTTFY
ncbi:Gfo/Idh/MocA family protein [Aestuariibaculum sediminum]|uniref:Gfo/Idh/MocA family oxidoreductase n=1 Tax=Aestuariibaculum sediminum TaxID=2770637 RepID=A0A8J6U893_9FLAO|nr:Gfo/Idh/MocA family oxidoreductase [Aestuariibaculum sediminum]MBD0832948.1 Gfo/Idh/MocA family oxidoreductase [Aestuariibaculum sediminum]